MAIIALFFLCWIVIYAIAKWLFPNELVVTQAQRILKNRYGLVAQIEHASIDPFARIELNGLTLSPDGDLPPFIHVKSIKIGYDFWPLLRNRQLRIRQILIDSPTLELVTLPDGRWNVELLLDKFQQNESPLFPGKSPDSAMTFPVRIALDVFSVTNIKLTMSGNTEDFDISASLQSIDCQIRDLSGSSPFTLYGKIIVNIQDGPVNIQLHHPVNAAIDARLTFNCAATIDSNLFFAEFESSLSANSPATSLQGWKPQCLPEVSASGAIIVDQAEKKISADPFVLAVDQIAAETQFEVVLDSVMSWSLNCSPMKVQLASVLKILEGLNLPETKELPLMPSLTGSISLDSLRLSGKGTDPKLSSFQAHVAGGGALHIPQIDSVGIFQIAMTDV
ncbi:hypothetical protein AMJ86_05835 [bacterium SM23_57]|nr:MAG: hypothetical protein AMJ86_05835 [bacterium SM23_57]